MFERQVHSSRLTMPERGIIPRSGILLLLLTLIHFFAFPAAAQEPSWELRVCADPARMPFSNRAEEGFENVIAEILADELGATLTYEWVSFSNMSNVRTQHLDTGACDLVFGLDDGTEGYLNSLAYLRSPYMFIQRAGTEPVIEDFDDLQREEVRLGIQDTNSSPYLAVIPRELSDKLVRSGIYGQPGDSDWLGRVVDEVADGTIDVGIAWGPIAGYYAMRAPTDIDVAPVQPEVEPPFLMMMRSITIGVRPHDVAFRDRLDVALANRWDQLQDVFSEYAIPTMPLPPPSTAAPDGAKRQGMVVGVVLPTPPTNTRELSPLDPAALSAQRGAQFAYDRTSVEEGRDFLVLFANAPDATSTRRAARRLVATEEIDVLVGGLTGEQSTALAAVAAEAGIPLITVGTHPVAGQAALCTPSVFHIGASPATFLTALNHLTHDYGIADWHVVHTDDARGQAILERAARVLAPGSINSTAFEANQLVFTRVFDTLRANQPDAVLLVANATNEQDFLLQYENAGIDIPVFVIPGPGSQTRTAYSYLLDTAPVQAATPRLTTWDASLDTDLNEEYASRWGTPMDPAAWRAYAAIALLAEVARSTGDHDRDLTARIQEDSFELSKDEPLMFDAATRELRQPLYVTEPDPGIGPVRGTARLSVTHLTALANVTDKVPTSVLQQHPLTCD